MNTRTFSAHLTFITVWLLFLCSPRCLAQQNNRFVSYTVADGLSQSSVWGITQDKNGFLWVATSDGLCRFDGYSFKIYKNNPNDPHSIISGKDNHFFLDKQQQLWITSANGISLYNYDNDNFRNVYTHNTYGPEQVTETQIYGEWNGFIWAALSSHGFIKINVKTHRCEQIKFAEGVDLSANLDWRKGFIESGCIYGNNSKGFFKYDISTNSITQLYTQFHTGIINLNSDEILTSSTTALYYINKKTLQVATFPITLKNSPSLVLDIIKAGYNEVLLGSTEGMHYINLQTKKVVNEITNLNSSQKDSYSYVQCFFTDKSGNLWIGTNGDGLHKLIFPFKKIGFYQSTNPKHCLVKGIYVNEGVLYTGYFNNGVDMFSKDGTVANIDVSKFGKGLKNTVFGIAPMGADNLLLYVFTEDNAAIYKYSLKTKTAQNITPLINRTLNLKTEFTTTEFAFAHHTGNTVIASCNEYLFSIDEQLNIKLIKYFKDERISSIFKAADGTLWIGTYECVYHLNGDNVTKINLAKKTLVKTLSQDGDGNIWAGTLDGIYVITQNATIKNHYSETNGLIDQFVYGILRDDNNDMWFSTNKGLGRYKHLQKQFDFFTNDDGLQSDEFDTGAFYKTADGKLYFGGINGTNSFYPKDIKNNPNVLPVKLTSIKLFDKPYKTNTAYWNVQQLNLPYTANSLSFEFILPEYTNPAKNRYAYIMEGVDKQWINSGSTHFARYAGLQPAHYIFKVKAANNDGIWGTPSTVSIDIVPPYWQRAWFKFLMFMLSISIVALAVYLIQKENYREKLRVFEVQQKIQSERERISRDLHDNIGTHLSLINKSIREASQPQQMLPEQERLKKLNSAQQGSSDVIDMLRETIWALNKQQISLEEFSDNLKTFVQKKLLLYADIPVEFDEQEENEHVMLNSPEALHLFRICQEALTNIVKYAEASAVKITVSAVENKYGIIIADNGKGFDPQMLTEGKHYGLQNMAFRATEIGCDFNIDSVLGKGTKISITQK